MLTFLSLSCFLYKRSGYNFRSLRISTKPGQGRTLSICGDKLRGSPNTSTTFRRHTFILWKKKKSLIRLFASEAASIFSKVLMGAGFVIGATRYTLTTTSGETWFHGWLWWIYHVFVWNSTLSVANRLFVSPIGSQNHLTIRESHGMVRHPHRAVHKQIPSGAIFLLPRWLARWSFAALCGC